jgi:superfamily I DNA and/or RNA helicase
VHGVYEGNTVVLIWETPDGRVEFLDGIVDSIKGSSIEIDIGFGAKDHNKVDLSRVDQVTIRVVEKGVAEQREYSAFKQLAKHSKSLLCGRSEIEFSSPLDLEFESELDLNTYQERAAVSALCADDVFCIHGPPGTGKTRTLVAIIEQTVKSNETVLVCAHSNQAVDNIVAGESTKGETDAASIHQTVQRFEAEENIEDISLVRLSSSPREVDSFVVPRYFLSTDHLESNIGGADIIASTTNTAAVLDDCNEVDIDLVVIDEATQASGPATAVPFGWGKRIEEAEEGWPSRSYGHRTILAGDHRQLPPFVSDPEMRSQGLHTSLFERLLRVYGDDLMQTLYRQYRMHEDIATFASEEFYDGQLEHGEQNRAETITGLSPLLAIDDNSGDRQKEGSHSYYNPTEARYVVAQVQKTLNKGIDSNDIGVITGYSDQRQEIKSELSKAITEVGLNTIDVETIDKFQGGQKEVMIISFTRSNSNNDSGFFELPPEVGRKRLNVALTRAKKRLVLIGDWNTLSTPASFRNESESCADTFARLEEYLREKDCIISSRQ